VLRIVSQNITKPLDSFGSGRIPLASVNHNVRRCSPDAWENLSSAEQKARLADLNRVRVARYRQNEKEKAKAKESVIVNSNVTRAASIEETIQPFAVLENTEQSVHQEDVREAPSEINPVETSVPLSSNRSCLFRMFPAPMRGRGRPPKHSNRRSKSSQASQQKAKSKRKKGCSQPDIVVPGVTPFQCLSSIHFAVQLKLDDEVQLSEEVPEVTSVQDSSVSTVAMTEEDCTEPPHVRWQLRSVNFIFRKLMYTDLTEPICYCASSKLTYVSMTQKEVTNLRQLFRKHTKFSLL
jgi:hypothetical protein